MQSQFPMLSKFDTFYVFFFFRDKNEQIERERQLYLLRQESLIERGVSGEHAVLLPTDSADPLSSPIQRDLQATREHTLRKEISAKRQ